MNESRESDTAAASPLSPTPLSAEEKADLRSSLIGKLQAMLVQELDRNRVVSSDLRQLPSGGLRRSLLFAALSLALALGVIVAALGTYRVQEEDLFLRPSELFGTEGLLINALKARTDLEISKRDQIIAAYERRARLRESRALDLLGMDQPKAASGVPATDAGSDLAPEDVVLEALNRESSMIRLLYGSLAELLGSVSLLLDSSDQDAARATLLAFGNRLEASADADTEAVANALSLIRSLESSIRRIEAEPAASDEALNAALESAARQEAAFASRLAELQKEVSALKREESTGTAGASESARDPALLAERVLELELENARLEDALLASSALRSASPTQAAATFLGTVSIVAGERIVVDIAGSSAIKPDDLVFLYRPQAGGGEILVAIAVVKERRGSVAELSLRRYAAPGQALKVRDTAYLGAAESLQP